MCGRYATYLPPEHVRAFFGTANPLPNLAANYNVAPTTTAPVVRRHPETGALHLDPLRWGLVPHWARDVKDGARAINARSETVASKPSFGDAYRKRRCIVPADAFYE